MKYNTAEPQSINKLKLEIHINLHYLNDSNLPLKPLSQDLYPLTIRQTPCINTFPHTCPKNSMKWEILRRRQRKLKSTNL